MKMKLFGFIVLVCAVLFITNTSHAQDDWGPDVGHGEETTVPTSTIGSINGPADPGPTTTVDPNAPTTVWVDECMFVGDINGNSIYPPGTGQTAIGLLECDLPVVETGNPPVPGQAARLPATGAASIGMVILGFCLIAFGAVLYRIRRACESLPGD